MDNDLELARQKLDLVSLENPKRQPGGESSTKTHTYRLYSKGLMSEELIKDDTMLVGGSGLSLCDSNDNSKWETNKPLRNRVLLAHPEDISSVITVRKDISSVIKLARDAIASQTRWREGDTNTEYETCPACYAHVSPRDKLEVSGCFHRICYMCIRDSVSSELARGDTVLCPYPDCKKEVVLEDCRGIVDDDAINLMIHRKKEKANPILDRVYCPKPSCNFLMSDRDLALGYSIDPRQKSVARKCVECGLCFCKKCHVPWHYKKTCDEFKKSESYLTSDAALFESLV